MKKNKQLLIISLSALTVLTVALLIIHIQYNSCSVEFSEKETIKQEIKFPEPPEERYISGVIKNVGKESFIVLLKNNKKVEVFLNNETEIFQGEGKGEKVSKEAIQPDWHVACFLPKNENNNTALIVHLTTSVALNNK